MVNLQVFAAVAAAATLVACGGEPPDPIGETHSALTSSLSNSIAIAPGETKSKIRYITSSIPATPVVVEGYEFGRVDLYMKNKKLAARVWMRPGLNITKKTFHKKFTVFLNFMDQGIRGSVAVNVVEPRETYAVICSFELQELTLLRFSSGTEANVEHPDKLNFSFTVSPGYVKIS